MGDARRVSQLFDSSIERNASSEEGRSRRGNVLGTRPPVSSSQDHRSEGENEGIAAVGSFEEEEELEGVD
jgi:hypothetical protein